LDLTHVNSNPQQYFKNTIARVNQFLRPIDLVVYRVTMFMSSSNVIGENIHCDGIVDTNGNVAMLEARINLYEMSAGVSGIEWWDSLPNRIPQDDGQQPWWQAPKLIPNPNGAHPFVICLPPFRHDLRSGKISWNQVPKPDFDFEIASTGAFVRTNRPHRIVQSGGIRVTLSMSLIFQDGRLQGVWDHIQRNQHLLHNDTTTNL
jgi:hypothetical protein